MSNHTMPLAMASVGEPVKLVSVNAGQGLVQRLADLGLTPGVEITVMQSHGGPLMISVRDSRLALGRGMAHKVRVSPVEAKR